MRTTFIDQITEAAGTDDSIVLMVGDLGYSVIEKFRDSFPERFFNVGVAEQNLIATAAGMASEGHKVFVYSITNFPTFRCAEQIRNDVDYHNLPVCIVSVGGGLTYGALGYSHHTIQDFGLMRLFPNMTIASPGGPDEVAMLTASFLSSPRPTYLRLAKNGEAALRVSSSVSNLDCIALPISKAPLNDVKRCVLATGGACQLLLNGTRNYPSIPQFSVPRWGQPYKARLAEFLSSYSEVTTIEDHLFDGGFASYVLEVISQYNIDARLVEPVYLSPEVIGKVGSQKYLENIGGLRGDK